MSVNPTGKNGSPRRKKWPLQFFSLGLEETFANFYLSQILQPRRKILNFSN
jgi:hypothetical protein